MRAGHFEMLLCLFWTFMASSGAAQLHTWRVTSILLRWQKILKASIMLGIHGPPIFWSRQWWKTCLLQKPCQLWCLPLRRIVGLCCMRGSAVAWTDFGSSMWRARVTFQHLPKSPVSLVLLVMSPKLRNRKTIQRNLLEMPCRSRKGWPQPSPCISLWGCVVQPDLGKHNLSGSCLGRTAFNPGRFGFGWFKGNQILSERFFPQCPLGSTQEFLLQRHSELGWGQPSVALLWRFGVGRKNNRKTFNHLPAILQGPRQETMGFWVVQRFGLLADVFNMSSCQVEQGYGIDGNPAIHWLVCMSVSAQFWWPHHEVHRSLADLVWH